MLLLTFPDIKVRSDGLSELFGDGLHSDVLNIGKGWTDSAPAKKLVDFCSRPFKQCVHLSGRFVVSHPSDDRRVLSLIF